MLLTVVDYGVGNLRSIAKSIEKANSDSNLSYSVKVSSDVNDVTKSDKIVLPGQGSFKACKAGIDNIKGLQAELNESVLVKKKPIYGICAGMQLFATKGHEEETTLGLNWIPGEVNKLNLGASTLKIPHMGWNELKIKNSSKVFQDINNNDHAYFIHSYEFIPEDKKVVSLTSNYGKEVMAAVSLENIFGSQFHPEKSQNTGIKILTNFLNL
ncbi:imidazole glycerol phosphate synthase subunit HisH [Pelagibacteraceae bacterium]|jgi:imidazole glycerol-phosphate synthase subunit HisH|nr:imidazole glycerol phosphate synthase subunit HisH [Pelagibacteraceae bacterium]MDC0952239.1 imidazole glycerol phosphate synthase subunit HisH [Pelagibacteraceae bacterium]